MNLRINLTLNLWRVVALILALGCSSAAAQDAFDATAAVGHSDNLTVTGSGTGQVEARPDLVTLTVRVITKGPTLASTNRQADDRVQQLYAVADKYNIYFRKKRAVSTTGYVAKKAISQSPEFYEVDKTISLELKNSPLLLDLLTDFSAFPDTEVPTVEYSLSDSEHYRQEARKIAFKNAKKDATDLADRVGLKLGSFLRFNPVGSLARGGFGSENLRIIGELLVDSLTITENVSVTYKLVGPTRE